MRSTRLHSRFFIASIVVAAGCVGSPTSTSGGGQPDAPGGGGQPDGRPGDAPMIDAPPAPFMCRNKITTGLDTGHHNAGQNCQQSCHNHGFFMSGTIYTSASGTTPAVGASLTFVDANGMTGDMVSGLNGNFWWAVLDVTFPVKITASSCPDIKPMVMTVNASGAGCNKTGCHDTSGTTGNRIHLP
jgi:hypothetical protein